MTTTIAALNESSIKHCLLIDITVNSTTYYVSNAYAPIVYLGNSYTQLGHFMAMSEIQDDLKVTNNQISITLSGIPPDDGSPNFLSIVLNSYIKGGKIKIYRAFFDISTGYYNPTQVYLRFSGYISNYNLSENWEQDSKTTSNAVGIQCSSIHAIMEKKYTGRRTNDGDQQRFFPGDTGMYRVKSLADTQFDFGKPYSPSPATPGSNDTFVQTEVGGG
jgi:hypothetical protein